jgi:hypothetical protein
MEAERTKSFAQDNPRQLGKEQARLVGGLPRKAAA